jgi:hypothetical protein
MIQINARRKINEKPIDFLYLRKLYHYMCHSLTCISFLTALCVGLKIFSTRGKRGMTIIIPLFFAPSLSYL